MELYASQPAKSNVVNKTTSYKSVRGFKTKPIISSHLKPLETKKQIQEYLKKAASNLSQIYSYKNN